MWRRPGVRSTDALGLVGDDEMPAIDVNLVPEPALYGIGRLQSWAWSKSSRLPGTQASAKGHKRSEAIPQPEDDKPRLRERPAPPRAPAGSNGRLRTSSPRAESASLEALPDCPDRGARFVANAIARREAAGEWKRSCGPRQPDGRDWAKSKLRGEGGTPARRCCFRGRGRFLEPNAAAPASSHALARMVLARSGPRWGSSAGSRKGERSRPPHGQRHACGLWRPGASLPLLPGLYRSSSVV